MDSQNKLVLENCVKRVVINCYNKEVKVLRIRNKKNWRLFKKETIRGTLPRKKTRKLSPKHLRTGK